MELKEEFLEASEKVKNLSERPNNEELLQLYALFKQGQAGDCSGIRPGIFDLKGRKKFDAWSRLKGKSQQEAQQEYIIFVQQLSDKY